MHRKTINTRIAKPFIWIIKGYQYTLSPDKGFPSFWLKGRVCMHTPHCSQYSVNAFKRYGFRPGIFYATDRVLHCTGGMNKIYDPDHYKIVFFSSAPIGVSFLQELNKDPRYEVGGVVTQCDKPSGRGMQMSESIIKQEAKKIKTSSSSNSFSF
ncbi:MAG: membrane protein insertion efficiency factor YidD [bacterium]